MSKRTSHRHRDVSTPTRNPNGDDRTQMRDAVDIARRTISRRFAVDTVQRHIDSLRRLDTEDLRRTVHERTHPNRENFKLEDGRKAQIRREPVRASLLPREGMFSQVRVVFRDSRHTIVCVRRRNRRSVLFALRKIGGFGRRIRPARWTQRSYIVCRRVK